MTHHEPETATPLEPFAGFTPLDANFLHCPNQFFDVCLPNHSRSAVRLVAYLLRRTLGWLDENGNPVEQDITVSYTDLVTNARISRGAIRPAIDEALAAKFIDCINDARPDRRDAPARSAAYRLRWGSVTTEYVTDASQFDGFFCGNGNFSPIPNAFFDRVVPYEPLAVVKVVATVLRQTVGYANQFGTGRRSHAPISYSFIQRYTNLRDRTTLSTAIHHALDAGYIRRVRDGCIDTTTNKRQTATYAVHWRPSGTSEPTSSETLPVRLDQFKKPTSTSSETRPTHQFKRPTNRKTNSKDTSKQQHNIVVAVENSEAHQLLIDAGFDQKTATTLSRSRGVEEIKQQIAWLPKRNADRNSLGMLRRAIEENWAPPETIALLEKSQKTRDRARHDAAQQAAHHAELAEQIRRRHQEREKQLAQWRSLNLAQKKTYYTAAIDRASSEMQRRRLMTNVDINSPPTEVLQAMVGNAATCP